MQEIKTNWLQEMFEHYWYNCKKNRHQWGYKLSKSGVVYMDDRQVPKDLWECLRCGVKLHK